MGSCAPYIGAMSPRRVRTLAVALAAASCARRTNVSSPDATPLTHPGAAAAMMVQASAATILLIGLELPPAGTAIGGQYGGPHDDRVSTYHLTDAVRARWAGQARERGEALMRGAGYRVRSVGPASSDARQLLGVQYGLSGRVTLLAIRSTGASEPLSVEALAEVSWELLDLGSGTAVFGRSLRGSARITGTVDDAAALALGSALERLIVDTLFIRALAAPRADPDAGTANFTREIPSEHEPIVLVDADLNPSTDTSLIARVSAGVVTLRSQDRGRGTAFILTRDGLALGIGRSVRNARQLRARFASGVERPARVLRTNAALDISLIQIACAQQCPTVDWSAPDGVDVFTGFVAIGAPASDDDTVSVTIGRVGGRWGLANGVTLQGAQGLVAGGEPVARINSGKVFGLVSARPGRTTAVLLSEALRALRVRAPEALTH